MKRLNTRKHKYHIKGGGCGCSQSPSLSMISKGGSGYVNPASYNNTSSIPHYSYNTHNNSVVSPDNITSARLLGGKRKRRSFRKNKRRSCRKSRGGNGLYKQFSNYYTSSAGTTSNKLLTDPTNHKHASINLI